MKFFGLIDHLLTLFRNFKIGRKLVKNHGSTPLARFFGQSQSYEMSLTCESLAQRIKFLAYVVNTFTVSYNFRTFVVVKPVFFMISHKKIS